MPPLACRRLSAAAFADVRDLQSVLAAAPAYSLLVEGRPPAPTAADDLLAALPPDKSHVDKFVFGFYDVSGPIGCADVIRGYPTAEVAFIGLLAFAEPEQGKSHGVRALRQIEELAKSWGCTALRISVIETNPRALGFWRREGFTELYRKPAPHFTGQAIVMERAIGDPRGASGSATADP